MRRNERTMILGLSVIAAGCSLFSVTLAWDDPAVAADPQAQLDTALEFFIKTCKHEEYEVLIFQCVHPVEVSNVLKTKSREELKASFKERKLAALWAELFEVAKKSKPEFSEGRVGDKKVATYRLDKEVSGINKVVFILRDGKWYIFTR